MRIILRAATFALSSFVICACASEVPASEEAGIPHPNLASVNAFCEYMKDMSPDSREGRWRSKAMAVMEEAGVREPSSFVEHFEIAVRLGNLREALQQGNRTDFVVACVGAFEDNIESWEAEAAILD